MSHLDGVNWGYDQIDPFNEIPFSFDLATTEKNRVILTAKDEYPRPQAVEFNKPLPTLSERGLVRVLSDPGVPTSLSVDDTAVRERFGNRELQKKFKQIRDFDIFSSENIHIVLFFLLIMVIVIQVKIYTAMDTMIKMRIVHGFPATLPNT